MIKFFDEIFDINKIDAESVFICAIGYEERSYYLLRQFRRKVLSENILVFSFDEHVSKTDKMGCIDEEQLDDIQKISVVYDAFELFIERTKAFLSKNNEKLKNIDIYIDYSYLPRLWYCKLPTILKTMLPQSTIHFLYAEGTYPENYYDYPSAGIKSLVPYAGKPSLRSDMKRAHIIALSYDVTRTEGLLSLLDPESIITCTAHDPEFGDIYDHVSSLNKRILDRADMSLSFHMDNFSFMIAKLCETANEHLPLGDVIIVPDGPKPLIFALSLAAEMLSQRPGITCMQILRNNFDDKPIEVKANGKIVSFCI